MKKISVISAVYNAEECLEELIKQIKFNLKKYTKQIEIILINDCSTDNSWPRMLRLKKKNKCLKIYNLKKNFGQHYAFRYGAKKATGEKIFFLDCDLEHHPRFFSKFLSNYNPNNIIAGKYDLSSTINKGLVSNIFWLLYSLLTFKNHLFISNYILIPKVVLKKLVQKKKITYLYQDLISLNFDVTNVSFKRMKRFKGTSSYTYLKLIKLAFALIKSRINLLQ